MKTLVLVRHAKSSWGDPGLPDHSRPLNDRGRRDAPEMGRRMKQRDIRPDVILSSTAVRARTTAQIIAASLDVLPASVVLEDRLYAASVETLLAVIQALDDSMDCVVLVGHNPEMTGLAQHFAGDIGHMPTCAVAEFGFAAGAWAAVPDQPAAHVFFDSPGRDAWS